MASPKKAPKKGDAGDAYVVGPAVISNVFNGFLGDDESLAELEEEHWNLTQHEKIVLENRRDAIKAKRLQREARYQARLRELEEKRLWERRNNPENLSASASQIQKHIKSAPFRKQFKDIIAANGERAKKQAIIICVDQYDDPRVREPTIVAQDAQDMAKVLQSSGFQVDVYSAYSPHDKYRPTKANITRALEMARTASADTMMWVHVCGNGGVGSVIGKNPFKAAQTENATKQTPRTRMLRALQSNHRAPGQTGAGGGGGDVCKFILPMDARSARLTYESVLSLDELLTVVDPRYCQTIFNQPSCQRLLTVDACAYGATPDAQSGGISSGGPAVGGGGGFGLIASTVSGKLMIDLPPAPSSAAATSSLSRGAQPVVVLESHRGIVGRCILRALLGADWGPVRVRRTFDYRKFCKEAVAAFDKKRKKAAPAAKGAGGRASPSPSPSRAHAEKEAAANAEKLKAAANGDAAEDVADPATMTLDDDLGDVEETGLCVTALVDAIRERAKVLRLSVDESGRKWGEIPLLCGDRAATQLGNLELIHGISIDEKFGVAAANGGLEPSVTATGLVGAAAKVRQMNRNQGRPRVRLPSHARGCTIEVQMSVVVHPEKLMINPFELDFQSTLFHWTSVMAQPDPTAAPHRWLRLQPSKTASARRVCIGIAASFTEITTRLRANPASRLTPESEVWAGLVDRLLERPAGFVPDKTQRVRTTTISSPSTTPLPTLVEPAIPSPAPESPGAQHQHHGNSSSKPHAAGHKSVTLPPIDSLPSPSPNHNQGPSAPGSRRSSVTGLDASVTNTPSPGASAVSPLFAASVCAPAGPADGSPQYSLYLGKPEEGGVCLAIHVRTNDDIRCIAANVAKAVPEALEGVKYQSMRIEVDTEVFGCVRNVEALRDQARGWFTPVADEEDEDTDDVSVLVARAKREARRRRSNAGNGKSAEAGDPQHPLGACHVTTEQMTAHLERLCQGSVRKPAAHVSALTRRNAVAILRVRPRVQRLNDLDDAAYEAMRQRERPQPLSMPYPAMAGIAICVVAMSGTPEQRARQAIELAKTATRYELYSGVRFMLWDASEVLWLPPGSAPIPGAAPALTTSAGTGEPIPGRASNGLAKAIAKSTGNAYTSAAITGSQNQQQQQLQQQQQQRREKLGKLLESVKGMIPSTNFPALLVLDLFKRRYYQTRLGLAGSGVYAAEQISQFCDDYGRGGLNDLLPPVKGCRVFGGSVVRTKYALIAV